MRPHASFATGLDGVTRRAEGRRLEEKDSDERSCQSKVGDIICRALSGANPLRLGCSLEVVTSRAADMATLRRWGRLHRRMRRGAAMAAEDSYPSHCLAHASDSSHSV